MTNTNYLNAISTNTTNIDGATYINSLTFKIEAISSTKVRFYKNDITKYSEPSDAPKIIATFNSIPIQLAKDNKKFQYKLVQKGGTSTIFGDSINWLVNAGIVPLTFKNTEDYDKIDQFDELELPDIRTAIETAKEVRLVNITKNEEYVLNSAVSERSADILLCGGLLSYTRENNK